MLEDDLLGSFEAQWGKPTNRSAAAELPDSMRIVVLEHNTGLLRDLLRRIAAAILGGEQDDGEQDAGLLKRFEHIETIGLRIERVGMRIISGLRRIARAGWFIGAVIATDIVTRSFDHIVFWFRALVHWH